MTRAVTRLTWLPLLCAVVHACSGQVYVKDSVTDGDTFFLAPVAMGNAAPVLQSWVRYSLMRSACQLEMGGPNPARATSFDCELKARSIAPASASNPLDRLLGLSRRGWALSGKPPDGRLIGVQCGCNESSVGGPC
jgi:hypothetical protein